METVYSREEAMDWFVNHSMGGVWGERTDGTRQYLEIYPDACAFFKEEE